MAVKGTYKPKIPWDQTAFEALKATWTPQRIAEDEKTLQEIFALAADVPLLAEALEWAEQHGVKFFIDRTATGIEGYYKPGTGVVAITAAGLANPGEAVESIVHEIRHAWQQYNGFGAEAAHGFSEYLITVSLKEADAEAFARRAKDQYKFYELTKNHKKVPDSLRAGLAKENADLGANFQVWFPLFAGRYGDRGSKAYNQALGLFPPEARLNTGLSGGHFEFDPARVKFTGENININNVQDVVRMGRFFSGAKNYLAALQPDILPKKILRPSLANTFWGAASSDQRKLTNDIRKAELKKKLTPENKRKHHPWP